MSDETEFYVRIKSTSQCHLTLLSLWNRNK